MSKLKDISGLRFGRLLVIERAGTIGTRAAWKCKCDCGNIKILQANNIGRTTRSCGCLNIDNLKNQKTRLDHGHYGSRTHTSWRCALSRCKYNKDKSWEQYGGRGIKFCDGWLKFENFLKDMGERPIGKTLDRIDVNGDYNKLNCRWATYKDQANNRRKKNA